MHSHQKEWNDGQMRRIMGTLLRVGVLTSAFLVVSGGILFFVQHPGESVNYSSFTGEPERLRHVHTIVDEALHLKSRAVIQLGLLFLIATPVARVLFSFAGFWKEKDWIYVLVTFLVMIILFFSLFSNYLTFS